jgi:hypothetical protein
MGAREADLEDGGSWTNFGLGIRRGSGMTAQLPDTLIHAGNRYSLYSNPLETYFEQFPPRPSFVPPHTANWRGYVAEWAVEEQRLYLNGLSGQICTRAPEIGAASPDSWCPVGHRGGCYIRIVGLADIMATNEERLAATWVSGQLTRRAGRVRRIAGFRRYGAPLNPCRRARPTEAR